MPKVAAISNNVRFRNIVPQELASTLRRVVVAQNGNTSPSSQTVLLVMELRADLEDRHRFHNTNREPEHVT